MKGKWKNSLKLFLYQEANIQEQGHYGCLVMPNNKTPSQHSFGARKERPQEKHQRDFIKKRALRTREARKVGNDPNWLSAEGVSETCSQKAARCFLTWLSTSAPSPHLVGSFLFHLTHSHFCQHHRFTGAT